MSAFVLTKDLDWVKFGRRIAMLYPIAHALGLVGLLMQGQPRVSLFAWIVVDMVLLFGVMTHRRFVAPLIAAHAIAFPFLSGEVGELFIWNLFLTPSSTVIFAALGSWGIWAPPRKGTDLPIAVSNCLLSALVFVVIAIQGAHHSWVEQGMRGTEFLAALFVSLVFMVMALWMARGSRVATLVGWTLLLGGMIFAAQDDGWIDWTWLAMSSTIWCLSYLAVVSVRGAFSVGHMAAVEHPRPFYTGMSRYAGRALATSMLLVLTMRVVAERFESAEQFAITDGDVSVESVVADEGDREGDRAGDGERFSEGVASIDKKVEAKSKGELKPRKTLKIPELETTRRAGIEIR